MARLALSGGPQTQGTCVDQTGLFFIMTTNRPVFNHAGR